MGNEQSKVVEKSLEGRVIILSSGSCNQSPTNRHEYRVESKIDHVYFKTGRVKEKGYICSEVCVYCGHKKDEWRVSGR